MQIQGLNIKTRDMDNIEQNQTGAPLKESAKNCHIYLASDSESDDDLGVVSTYIYKRMHRLLNVNII